MGVRSLNDIVTLVLFSLVLVLEQNNYFTNSLVIIKSAYENRAVRY